MTSLRRARIEFFLPLSDRRVVNLQPSPLTNQEEGNCTGVHVNKIKKLLSIIHYAVEGADSSVGSDSLGVTQHLPLPLMARDQ